MAQQSWDYLYAVEMNKNVIFKLSGNQNRLTFEEEVAIESRQNGFCYAGV